MDRVKLSIIIPCYNSENTVTRTLDCLCKEFSRVEQEYPDFGYEIIIVNDGSTDNTIAEIQQVKNEHISLINKKNSGVSDTRNFGFKYSTGDYVWFFDSDDLIFEDVGNLLYEYMSARPDIIRFSSVTVDRITIKKMDAFDNTENSSVIFRGSYKDFLSKNKIGFSCWGMIIRRERLIEYNILFNSQLSIGEDVLWNFMVADRCADADMLVSNLRVVKYMVNDNSIVNTINPVANNKYYHDYLQLYDKLTSLQPCEEYMDLSLEHYKMTTFRQIITKFLSCKTQLYAIKVEITKINKIINDEKINNTYSKIFKILSKNILVMWFSQSLYRNLFLRFIKPYIGRN